MADLPAELPLDADRALALLHAPSAARAALDTLWALDLRMAAVVRGAHEPQLGAIRLAWWRDALIALDTARPPDEPLLARIAGMLLPAGVRGADLAPLPSGWAPLLDPEGINADGMEAIATDRGATLFSAAAHILDPDGAFPHVRTGGEGWALTDIAFGVPDAALRRMALDRAASPLAQASASRWPARLRPIGMLAMLAAEDARAGARARPVGGPSRALRMLRHRFGGR